MLIVLLQNTRKPEWKDLISVNKQTNLPDALFIKSQQLVMGTNMQPSTIPLGMILTRREVSKLNSSKHHSSHHNLLILQSSWTPCNSKHFYPTIFFLYRIKKTSMSEKFINTSNIVHELVHRFNFKTD